MEAFSKCFPILTQAPPNGEALSLMPPLPGAITSPTPRTPLPQTASADFPIQGSSFFHSWAPSLFPTEVESPSDYGEDQSSPLFSSSAHPHITAMDSSLFHPYAWRSLPAF